MILNRVLTFAILHFLSHKIHTACGFLQSPSVDCFEDCSCDNACEGLRLEKRDVNIKQFSSLVWFVEKDWPGSYDLLVSLSPNFWSYSCMPPC